MGLLPTLVEFFCSGIWNELIEAATIKIMSAKSVARFNRSRQSMASAQDSAMVPTVTEVAVFEDGIERIFSLLDADGDGVIQALELQRVVQESLGATLSSTVVIGLLSQMVDENADGCISKRELRDAVRKLAP